MTFVYILLALILGFAAYVRLAPTDAAKFHRIADFHTDSQQDGGVKRVIQGDKGMSRCLLKLV